MKPDRARVLTEGLVTGILGYLAVVVFMALINVVSGRSVFYTASVLGQALTGGTDAAAATESAAVLAYNGVHLVVFLVVGFIASTLVFATERYPSVWPLFFLVFVGLLMVSWITFAVLAAPLSAALPVWAIVVANLLAAGAMGTYLLKRHPMLWATVESQEV